MKINKFVKNNKKKIIVLSVLLILVILILLIANNLGIVGNAINEQAQSNKPFVKPVITKENFQETIQKQAVIQELPKKAEISLIFSDTKEEYTITKSSITKTKAGNPDIIVSVPSSYIPETYNLCSAVKQANNNGDLSYQLIASKSSLLWKYKAMLKYRGCLG